MSAYSSSLKLVIDNYVKELFQDILEKHNKILNNKKFDHKLYVHDLLQRVLEKSLMNDKYEDLYKYRKILHENASEEETFIPQIITKNITDDIQKINERVVKRNDSRGSQVKIAKNIQNEQYINDEIYNTEIIDEESDIIISKDIITKEIIINSTNKISESKINTRNNDFNKLSNTGNTGNTPPLYSQSLSIKSLLQEKQLGFKDDLEKITKIQGAWRCKRDLRILSVMREKVFILQRGFRRFLIKKYDLPDNYFYNEKFLRIQHEKFEKNFIENMKVLFPAIFNDILKNSLNETENNVNHTRTNSMFNRKFSNTKNNDTANINANLFNNNLIHNAYEEGKIHLFAKILDVDLMIETEEVYENLWAKSFEKVYSHCLKSNSPLQLIAIGSAHTVCVNNKGRLFTFGWNNYGQCGVPINSTIIAKEDIENEYLVEMTEYNELRPRILNKVDGIKLPQIEEVILTKNIACGEDHTLILDHEGSVWAFGLNLNGQLGLGHQKVVERPTKIKSLMKHFITHVKSEGDINFAVSDKGEAFMWPWSDKSGNIMLDPIKLFNDKVKSLACGNNFVLILNDNGMVYSMGKTNNYGQLGHGDTLPKLRPTVIEFFQINNERVTQISCGFKHCVAKTSTGHAYTWGLGVKGQLGHSNYNNYTLPYMVKVESPLTKIYQVSAGFRSTFFLIENRKVYFCGCTGSVSMQNEPIQFITWEKVPELSNEANFSVVRIMNTWNKSFSIFYATIADTTTLKGINAPKLNQILLNLTTKCQLDTVDIPYIDSIAKYFPASYMRKLKDIYLPRK